PAPLSSHTENGVTVGVSVGVGVNGGKVGCGVIASTVIVRNRAQTVGVAVGARVTSTRTTRVSTRGVRRTGVGTGASPIERANEVKLIAVAVRRATNTSRAIGFFLTGVRASATAHTGRELTGDPAKTCQDYTRQLPQIG